MKVEVKDECRDREKGGVDVPTAEIVTRRGKKAKVEINDEAEAKVEVKDERKDGDEKNQGTDATTIKAVEKETLKTKIETKEEGMVNQTIDVTSIRAVRKRRKVKVEANEAGENNARADVELEEAAKKLVMKEERGLNLKLEDVGMTMADRIKRRRRR